MVGFGLDVKVGDEERVPLTIMLETCLCYDLI